MPKGLSSPSCSAAVAALLLVAGAHEPLLIEAEGRHASMPRRARLFRIPEQERAHEQAFERQRPAFWLFAWLGLGAAAVLALGRVAQWSGAHAA